MRKIFTPKAENSLPGIERTIRFDGGVYEIATRTDLDGKLSGIAVKAQTPFVALARSITDEAKMMSDSLKAGMSLQDCIKSQEIRGAKRTIPVVGHANVKSASGIWDAIFQVISAEHATSGISPVAGKKPIFMVLDGGRR